MFSSTSVSTLPAVDGGWPDPEEPSPVALKRTQTDIMVGRALVENVLNIVHT